MPAQAALVPGPDTMASDSHLQSCSWASSVSRRPEAPRVARLLAPPIGEPSVRAAWLERWGSSHYHAGCPQRGLQLFSLANP